MIFKKPNFWDKKEFTLLSIFLLPFTLFISISNWINFFFLKEKFKIKSICVGNIYVGGTGKTPLSIEIYEILKKIKYHPVLIKKKSTSYLDEIKLLETKGNFISLKSRKQSIKLAVTKNFKTAIIDDGLQDRSLNYDLKIVCFDKKNLAGNEKLIPAGPLREKLDSLKKYDIIFFNGLGKINPRFISKIKKINKKIKIFETYPAIISKVNKKEKYLIFSGIGNPLMFKNLLINNNFKIKKTLEYPDHYNYTSKDINNIFRVAKKNNLKILTTEKDYFRLNKEFRKSINIIKIKLMIKNKKKFIQEIKKI